VKKPVSILLFLLLVGMAPAVRAQPKIEFPVTASNTGASIHGAGGANPLTGSGIGVSQVQGHNTPLDSLVIQAVTKGVLSLTTGNFAGTNWQFGLGRSDGGIGAIPDAGSSSTTTLLQRIWFSAYMPGKNRGSADTTNPKEKYLNPKW
jgi:hypothetical protein